jgi:hypothetical protein
MVTCSEREYARARRTRVDVRLPGIAGPRQHRELGAFAWYCVARIERDLGESQRWIISIAPVDGKFTSTVVVLDHGSSLETSGQGLDGTLATWDAMCKIEQALCEARAQRRPQRLSRRGSRADR